MPPSIRELLCTVGLLASVAHGQVFMHFGTGEGLPNQSVTRLMQDRQGFVWVATREGLARFDGERFTPFTHDPAVPGTLPHDHVERMHQGPDGRIWTTSGNGGLTVHLPLQERFLTWRELTGVEDPAAGIPTRAVHAIAADSIYVGVFGQGLWLYLPREGRSVALGCTGFQGPCTAESIFPRPDDPRSLLVVYGDRIAELDTRTGLSTMRFGPVLDDRGRSVAVTNAGLDATGALWVGTWGRGLWRWDDRAGQFTEHLHDTELPLTSAKNIVHAVLPLRDGALVGTERGLFHFTPSTGGFQPLGADLLDARALPTGGVAALLMGRDSTVFVGHAVGLSLWDPAQDRFTTLAFHNRIEQAFPLPRVTAMVEEGGRLLLGTVHGDGLLRERADGSFEAIPFPEFATEGYKAVQVFDLRRLHNGRIIAFTGRGIMAVEGFGERLVPLFPELFSTHGAIGGMSFLEDRHGHWWFGHQRRGLYHLDPLSGQLELIGEEGAEVRRLTSSIWCQGLAEDAGGSIWVNAYEKGISRISPDRRRIDHYEPVTHPWLPTGKVWDLVVDAQDRLWLGTNGQGVLITPAGDPGGNGTAHLLRGASGLPAMISALQADDAGQVWAAGPSGLFRADPASLRVARFAQADGLRGTDLHHATIRQHPGGRITLVARMGELIVAHGRRLEPKPVRPAGITVHALLINGKPFSTDTAFDLLRSITLAPGEDHLELAFGAIAFGSRSRVRLAHQLIGLEEEPTVVGASGRLVHARLPHGTYTLRITDVTFAEKPAPVLYELRVAVRPWFWRTAWFRVAVAVLLLLVLWLVQRWRLARARERARAEADHRRRLAEVEMQALRAQMNPHFLFNSLNSINRFIIANEPRTASEYLTKFARLMRGVLHNSKERLVPLKDELEALRLYVELEALRFGGGFRYSAEIALDGDPATIMVPPMLLQPYVENAIWHGLMPKKEGERLLTLRVGRENGSLVFEVEDNGIGRARAAELQGGGTPRPRSMGMRITRERLDLVRTMYDLDTSIQVADLYDIHKRPAGTRVVVRIQGPHP